MTGWETCRRLKLWWYHSILCVNPIVSNSQAQMVKMVKTKDLAHGTVVTSDHAQATELLKLSTSVVPSD